MPRFATISPTHISGKKEYAWQNFLRGNYAAIGWLQDVDLTGKSIDEIKSIIRPYKYPNEASAIQSFGRFLELEIGDYLAINNTNHGLFGIGIITSGYKYQFEKHDSGAENKNEY